MAIAFGTEVATGEGAGMTRDWNSHEFNAPQPGWVEVDETGWAAIKLWCAGSDNRARAPRDDRGRVVLVICDSKDGRTESFEPFTAEDLHVIEEGIDSYLADAGLPPLPHGYRWFLRIPDGLTGDLLDHIDEKLNPRLSGTPTPIDWLRQLQPIMHEIYPSTVGSNVEN